MPEFHAILVSLDEAIQFVDTSSASAPYRDQADRFEVDPEGPDAADLLAQPQFDNGSLHWVPSRLEALVLAKVLIAEGFDSHIVWDLAPDNDGKPLGFVVLTERPFTWPAV